MEIKKLQIVRIHVPNTKPEDDYAAIKINDEVYRTEDIGMVRQKCEKFLKGITMPEEKVINVKCVMCDVQVDIPLSQERIISTDQGAGFIRKPDFICEKCGSTCEVTLPEPTG